MAFWFCLCIKMLGVLKQNSTNKCSIILSSVAVFLCCEVYLSIEMKKKTCNYIKLLTGTLRESAKGAQI